MGKTGIAPAKNKMFLARHIPAGTWRLLALSFAPFAGLLLVAGPHATYGHHGSILLPDPAVTPGAIRTIDADAVCNGGSTKQFRHTTSAMKKQVCAAYGVKHCPKAKAMELDHLLPLELGGADKIENLWVQPAPEFHWKDDLENVLHSKVCKTKEIELALAQQCIVADWASCYEKQIGPLPTK